MKPTDNIILNGEKFEATQLKSEMRQWLPVFLLPFNILLKILVEVIQQEKKFEMIQTGK